MSGGWTGDLRSLLSGEALEEDLCFRVDAEVVDGLGVRRRGGAVGALGELAQGGGAGPDLSGEGLHGWKRVD